MSTLDADEQELRKVVRRIIENGPSEFDSCAKRARAVKSVVASEIATCIEPALNEKAETMPQDTLSEKRDLAAWVNHELRQLGLAIQCDPSGMAGILVAMPGRRDDDEGSRFRVEARDTEGHKSQSSSLGWVPRLALVEAPVRREGRSRFRS